MDRAVPILPVDDLHAAREFYIDKLGFTAVFQNSDDGHTGILEIARGTISLPPHDEAWGARTFNLQDSFGNTIFVIGPLSTAG